jgi:hypothetical protein
LIALTSPPMQVRFAHPLPAARSLFQQGAVIFPQPSGRKAGFFCWVNR